MTTKNARTPRRGVPRVESLTDRIGALHHAANGTRRRVVSIMVLAATLAEPVQGEVIACEDAVLDDDRLCRPD